MYISITVLHISVSQYYICISVSQYYIYQYHSMLLCISVYCVLVGLSNLLMRFLSLQSRSSFTSIFELYTSFSRQGVNSGPLIGWEALDCQPISEGPGLAGSRLCIPVARYHPSPPPPLPSLRVINAEPGLGGSVVVRPWRRAAVMATRFPSHSHLNYYVHSYFCNIDFLSTYWWNGAIL